MLRMGKNLEKEHIRAVIETSENPKADTCLQGLLGRCCGYRYDIDIYIPQTFIDNTVNNYVEGFEKDDSYEWMEGMMNVPNVSKETRSSENFTVPISLSTDIPVPASREKHVTQELL